MRTAPRRHPRVLSRRALRRVGTDPDPRFTFANERTFLAWNRTALALIAGGLAIGQFVEVEPRPVRLLIAIPPIVLGAAVALLSYLRWNANEHALRTGEPLPPSSLPWHLVVGIALAAVVITVVLVVELV